MGIKRRAGMTATLFQGEILLCGTHKRKQSELGINTCHRATQEDINKFRFDDFVTRPIYSTYFAQSAQWQFEGQTEWLISGEYDFEGPSHSTRTERWSRRLNETQGGRWTKQGALHMPPNFASHYIVTINHTHFGVVSSK